MLGIVWAVLQPALTAVIFTFVFGRVAGLPSDGVPYILFSLTGLVVWTFVAQGVALAANSLVGASQVITKVFFPRILIPTAAICAGLIDLAISLVVLMAVLITTGAPPGPRISAVPLLILLAMLTVLGVGLWLSALNVFFRDFRFVVPFLIQMWLFLSPVIYPASEIAVRLGSLRIPKWTLGLNPLTGVLEGLRWSVLGTATTPWPWVLTSGVVATVLFVSGVIFFRRMELAFADVV